MGRRRLPDEAKNCEQCGRPLARTKYGGQLEDRARFKARRFCDLTCSGAFHRKATPTLGALRKRHLPSRGMVCQQCGSQHLVSLHHIDENPANNDPTNVMTLCGSCHTKWHWQHGKMATPKRATECSVCGRTPTHPNDHIRRGMCQMHYQRWKRHGDPQAERPPLR